jgi:uncharacterized protein
MSSDAAMRLPNHSPHRRGDAVPSRKVFINLSVKHLPNSVEFWRTLGFAFDPQVTDEHAACMVLNDDAYVMLLDEARFKDFTTKDIADAANHTEVINALSADSRDEVDALVAKAFAAGAQRSNAPMDYGFMYGASFQDLDGHLWEILWIDPAAQPQICA